ncbi:MAG: TRAP transporter substrate-binding protein DctP [Acidobacteria bacterium]|nr:TRAP transporter substrate-binding protein DctP [Acidobacteriota bacterium]
MSALKCSLVMLAAVAVLAAPVAARAPITIKLATQAPVNSAWHKALLDMGAAWDAKTSGRVKLTVYAGGTQGDELSTIRMMRPGVDQLQANLLMVTGLSQIDNSFDVFGMPFFFESDAEATQVQQKLSPVLEQRLDAKGFRLLAWGSGGWVQLFSKKPLRSLDDVKAAKLFTSQGDDKSVQWYKANGFHPVALSANDIPTQLKLTTGMIDAAPTPPYPALVLQIFRDAKYMLDVRVAPLFGALVISKSALAKIDAADQQAVAAAAKAFEQRVMADAPKLDADSVATMKTRGLTVTTLDAKGTAEFRTAADKLVATMRGDMVPADVYDLAVREREAFRKTKGK